MLSNFSIKVSTSDSWYEEDESGSVLGDSRSDYSNSNQEVWGDCEREWLLEWLVILGWFLFSIHSRGPHSSAKILMPQNLLHQHGG